MKIITIKSRLDTLASRWAEQYHNTPTWYDGEKEAIYKKLLKASDREKLELLPYWVYTSCSECGHNKDQDIIELGQEYDYESMTAYICMECFQNAMTMVKNR